MHGRDHAFLDGRMTGEAQIVVRRQIDTGGRALCSQESTLAQHV
jgi:hypothetical protein